MKGVAIIFMQIKQAPTDYDYTVYSRKSTTIMARVAGNRSKQWYTHVENEYLK